MLNELAIVICDSFILFAVFIFLKAVMQVLCTGFREIFAPEQELDEPLEQELNEPAKHKAGRPKQYVKLVHPDELGRYYEKRGRK